MSDKNEATSKRCPKCGSDGVTHKGMGHAYGNQPVKYQHECQKCGHVFWVARPTEECGPIRNTRFED
jgi:DNA-directed RNA polymerase subunit M/transcription elongation factor TFIIS